MEPSIITNMKLIFVSTILIFALLQCKSSPKQEHSVRKSTVDTFRIGKKNDSLFEAEEDSISSFEFEVNKEGKAPVKVLNAAFVSKINTEYKDVQITYKNISKKVIASIQFRWIGVNAAGKPAEVGQPDIDDAGGGIEEDSLAAGKQQTSVWAISSRDGKKITRVWVHEVVFTDGTKWEASNSIK